MKHSFIVGEAKKSHVVLHVGLNGVKLYDVITMIGKGEYDKISVQFKKVSNHHVHMSMYIN